MTQQTAKQTKTAQQQYAVGDTVRVINGRGFVEDGTVTTVKSLDTAYNGDAAVYLDALNNVGCPTWLRTKYIEKVAEQMAKKFNVGDTVRAITNKYGMTTKSAGWEGVVTEVEGGKFDGKTTKGKYSVVDFVYSGLSVEDFELVNAKSTQSTPKKTARISVLEAQVAELTAKVEALEKAGKPAENFAKIRADFSPNEQRKAIIAEAKAFVEDVTKRMNNGKSDTEGNETFRLKMTIAKFHVNKEKRVVTALVYGERSGRLLEKAIAKCAPDDVFNADIGKAIALGRALGLDVKRFEQAVKPTEHVNGMLIAPSETAFIGSDKVMRLANQVGRDSDGVWRCHVDSGYDVGSTIIDDTDAQY